MTEKRRARYEKRLETYEATLELLYKAEKAILEGAQMYKIGSRQVTRADLATITKEIKEHEKKIDELENLLNGGGRNKIVGVIPRDY